MNSKIGLLTAMALFQIVLIAMFWFVPGGVDNSTDVLLKFDVERVTRMAISSSTAQVDLLKQDGTWQIDGAPADATKIATTLDKLTGLATPWPVGSSADIADRFELSEDNHQRKLEVYAGEERVGAAFFGTSPGFQRVHAREAADSKVFSVALSNHELGLDTDVWLDKGVFALETAPHKIVLDAADASQETLERVDVSQDQDQDQDENHAWQYNGIAGADDAAQTYANRYTNLRVLGLASSEQVANAQAQASITTSSIDASGVTQSRVYSISRTGEPIQDQEAEADEDTAANEGEYLISDDSTELTYRLATYVAEQLLMHDSQFELTAEG